MLTSIQTAGFHYSILDQIPVAISILRGPDFIIQMANKTNLTLLGKALPDVLNKPFEDIFSATKPQTVKSVLQEVYDSGATHKIEKIPIEIISNGYRATKWFALTCEHLQSESEGEAPRIMVVTTEITDQVLAQHKEENGLSNPVSRDIKGVKESEDDLQKAATHLQLATQSANVGTWSLDLKSQTLEWSALHKRMWGYDENRTNLLYEDWHNIILPTDKEKAFQQVEEARIHHTQYEVDYRIQRPNDNTLRWMRSSGKYYYDTEGVAQTLTGISMDITAQKEAEETIRKTQARLYTGLKVANIALAEINYITGMVLLAPETAEMYGLPLSNLNVTRQELHDTFHPDYKQELESQIDKALDPENGRTMEVEHPIVLPTGEVRWLKVNKQFFFDDSVKPAKSLYSILAAEDITARKQSEEKIKEIQNQLELTVENVNAAIYLFDNEGKMIFANDKAAQLYKYDSVEALLNEKNFLTVRNTINQVYDVLDENRHRFPYERLPSYVTMTTGKPAEEIILMVDRKDGSAKWVLAKSAPLFDEQGKLSLVIVSVTDITQQKISEEKIKEARGLLEITLNNVPSAIYHFDSTGKILYLNEIAAHQMGYDNVEEVLAEKDVYAFRKKLDDNFDLLDEDGNPCDPEKSCSFITLKTSEPAQEVLQFISKKTGVSFWLLTKSVPLMNEKGELTNVFTTCTDITVQKKSESALRQSENRYRRLFETSPLPIFDIDFSVLKERLKALMTEGVTDLDAYFAENPNILYELLGTITLKDVNDACVRMYGTPKEALLLSVEQFFVAETIPAFVEVIKAVAVGNGRLEIESIIQTHSGTRLNVIVFVDLPNTEDYSTIQVIIFDITESKLSELKLLQSEEKYRSLFDSMEQGFCIIEMIYDAENKPVDFRYLEGNPMFNKQTGFDNAIGKTIVELAPDIEKHWIERYSKVVETGESIHFTENSPALGRWFEVFAFPIDGEGSRKVAVLFTNISERKKSEQALEMSEQRFRNTFTNAAVGMALTDQNGKFISVNKAYQKIVGYTHEELQQLDFSTITHPDDRERNHRDIYALVESGKNDIILEKRYVRKNGTTVWVQISVALIRDENGEVKNIIALAEDITEEKFALEKIKQSEQTFRTLSNTLPQLVWMTNADGQSEFISKQWNEYSGIKEELDTVFDERLIHPEDKEMVEGFWKNSLKDGMPYKASIRLKHNSGEYRWNSCEGIVIRDNQGNIHKWVGACSDIHEEKMKEQKKDDFISIASHEMKTPLTTAKAYLQLLEMTLVETEAPSVYAKKATAAVERLQSLIAELLDASKIQNGKLNYTISTFDFNEMVDNTIESVQYDTTHAIIKTGTCTLLFSGDKDRLQQVVINLLTNAIKYSPNAKEVLIHIEQQKDGIKVSVTDKGVGMAKQHLDKVFDRYYRIQEHAIHFQGLGIGLYISYDIINRHGGKIWVESEVGKGSTFFFTLPFVHESK